MIKYVSGAYGFRILLRLHGSAAFKALTPALLSTAVYVAFSCVFPRLHEDDTQVFDHPYPLAALISAFSFMLTFKASFSYNRYWEAVTSVHIMHSKWLDVGMELAAFHLQMKRYTKPPSFGAHPEVKCLERERQRLNEMTNEQYHQLFDMGSDQSKWPNRLRSFFKKSKARKVVECDINNHLSFRSTRKSINKVAKQNPSTTTVSPSRNFASMSLSSPMTKIVSTRIQNGGMEAIQPPLFLQECAHLLSLLSAVAMSTLRNDIEAAESPLATFAPNAPWPHVDPDAYSADVRKDWARSTHRSWTLLRYLLGISRSEKDRTLYNAARPFRVVGGVSDAEVELLQAARGPSAKVALCSMWLQEFICREHLAGSLGAVPDPIISRLYQFTSDGMTGYNQARKVAYIPFPFPHSQIVSIFVLVTVVYIPVLMLTYVTNVSFGAVLNLLTVMCFSGLHEVARELEDPFQNVPNDIPANNFQAQFNEALMTMYMGYHPDSFWEVAQVDVDATTDPATEMGIFDDDSVKDLSTRQIPP